MAKELIEKFVSLHKETSELLDQNETAKAKDKYFEVLQAYHEIEGSTLEQQNKELAHDQVTSLFQKVNETKERSAIPVRFVLAGILVVAFSVLVFFQPSIVGLVGFEDLLRQPVEIEFTESGLETVTLSDRPLSLSVSGTFEGNAKLFYKHGDKLELILDSSKLDGNAFADVCMETCDVIADSSTVELFATIEEGSKLVISELSYRIVRTKNTAPAWRGGTKTFKARVGKTTMIDFSDYFKDEENDLMIFLSTAADNIDVSVENSILSLTPKQAGTMNLVFVATDLQDVTRVPVKIEAGE